MHPDAARLFRVPLFADLSDEDLQTIAGWMEVDEFPASKVIIREGVSDYAFFVLDEGSVQIEHDGRAIATLGAGDVFGELALLGDGHRRADVIAATDVRAFAMFGTRFREMQMSMPQVAARLDELRRRRVEQLG